MSEPIPGPAGWPLIGNLLDVQGDVPIESIERITDIYGPVVKMLLGGNERLFVGGFDIFDELCDETRFFKIPPPALVQGAPVGPQGLFSAPTEKDPDWIQAHRILMPAFGPLAIQNMFDEMYDIATQMVMKWARLGSERTVLLTEDFTRLTLDTISLCAMDYRFNSFYSETVHPYVQAMTNTLTDRSQAAQIGHRLKVLLVPSYTARLKQDVAYMDRVGEELVQNRRKNPTDKKDLLNSMIHGKDPKTGETMSDALIAANMKTFLVAGHETTSGLLSFAFMQMLLNPTTFFAAQEEVDRVVGTGRIEPHHVNELPYLNAVLRETLRLTPTVPAFARGVRPENKEEHVTVAGGKYEIPRNTVVLCLLAKIQRDPKVWGEDAEQFRPERMLDDSFSKLPKNAWKPFGTGLRACIGRAFAWQEALLVTALLLQNFNLSLADPGYKMQIQQTLTVKPKDSYVHVKLRRGINATQLMQRLVGRTAAPAASPSSLEKNGTNGALTQQTDGPSITILYGSNTGTCQSLAQALAVEARQHGYAATVDDLDSAVERVPGGQAVVIITASYEGQPPDNAAAFVPWLERVSGADAFRGVRFAVFGCGHADWASTYQRIPTLVDSLLAEHGGTRLAERGESDASHKDMFGDFAKWTEGVLWPALVKADAAAAEATLASDGSATRTARVAPPALDMAISTEQRATHLHQKLSWAKVTEVRQLTAPGEPEKRHIAFQLPAETSYRTGDYLAVLPLNPDDDVRRVVKRFGLPWDAVITIRSGDGHAPTTLPVGVPVSLADLVRGYVELALPATRRDIEILKGLAEDGAVQGQLQKLLDDQAVFEAAVLERRTSLLDLLEQFPDINLPLASFLAMLPSLRARHYSIASSPLASPDTCALCYSVIDGPAWSARLGEQDSEQNNQDGHAGEKRRFRGVTGTYLKSLRVGDQALVSVRATNQFFRPPPNPDVTPMLMFCAGSGFAPFRGFLQERAVLIREGGRTLAPAVMFVGCRSADRDRLYADEVDGWVRDGVVDVRYAFSQEAGHRLAAGCRYVSERLLRDRDVVVAQWEAGAKVYTCGSSKVAKDLGAAARQLILERAQERGEGGTTEADAADWMEARHNERAVPAADGQERGCDDETVSSRICESASGRNGEMVGTPTPGSATEATVSSGFSTSPNPVRAEFATGFRNPLSCFLAVGIDTFVVLPPGIPVPTMVRASPSTAAPAGIPAPYGRACSNCARAKCRCILTNDGTGCERCHRLKKDCRSSTPVRRRVATNRRTSGTLSRTAQLEQKLDGLVSLLTAQSNGRLQQNRSARDARDIADGSNSISNNSSARSSSSTPDAGIGSTSTAVHAEFSVEAERQLHLRPGGPTLGCSGLPQAVPPLSSGLAATDPQCGHATIAEQSCSTFGLGTVPMPRTPESSTSIPVDRDHPRQQQHQQQQQQQRQQDQPPPTFNWGFSCFTDNAHRQRDYMDRHYSLDKAANLSGQPRDSLNLDPALEPSPADAEQTLHIFRSTMLPYFPFVHLADDLTAAALRRSRPVLWLAIMAVTCQRVPTHEQLARSTHLRALFAHRIVFESEKTLDLLQALLAFLTWVHYTTKRDKPTLSVMTQLAVSLVYDLGLHKTPSSCKSMISRLVRDHYQQNVTGGDDTCGAAEQQDPTPPQLDERRAALACYVLTCKFSMALKRSEPLRWTPRMEEHLNELADAAEGPLDHVLVTQVRLQRVADHVHSGEWQHNDPCYAPVTSIDCMAVGSAAAAEANANRLLPPYVARVVRAKIDEIRETIPAEVRQYDAVLDALHATDMMVCASCVLPIVAPVASMASMAIIAIRSKGARARAKPAAAQGRDQPAPSQSQSQGQTQDQDQSPVSGVSSTTSVTADFARIAALERCMESVASFWAFFRQIASSSYAALPFASFAHFTHCVVLLYGLSVIDEPHWDRRAVRDRLHVLDLLDGFIAKLGETPRVGPAASATGPDSYDIFNRAAVMLSSVRELWAADIGRADDREKAAAAGVPDEANLASMTSAEFTQPGASQPSALASTESVGWQLGSGPAPAMSSSVAAPNTLPPEMPQDPMFTALSDVYAPGLFSAIGLPEDYMFWDLFLPGDEGVPPL